MTLNTKKEVFLAILSGETYFKSKLRQNH